MSGLKSDYIEIPVTLEFEGKRLKAALFSIEGKLYWIPKSVYKETEKLGTIKVKTWYYNKYINETS